MKIAITGATGQLGNLVIEQLLQLTAAQNIVERWLRCAGS